MGFEPNPKSDRQSAAAYPTAEELISKLRSSFFALEFQRVAKTLTEREQKMEEKYLKLKAKVEEERSVLVMEILKVKDELKKKEEEIEVLRKVKDEYGRKVRVLEKRCLDLDENVSSMEKIVKEQKGKDRVAESCRPPLFSEKEHSKKKVEPNLPKINTEPNLPEIIEIDDDDDGDDQRKRAANEIKREYNTEEEDDDDIKYISTLKRRRVSNEIKREPHAKFAKISSLLKKKIDLDSSASDPGSDMDEVDKAYMFSSAKIKKPKERWETESDMVEDLKKDDELCLNGVCALRRKKIIVHGADISRMSELARKLIDGDSQEKVKKKAPELNQFDLDQCRMFAKKYALQLFNIYQEKSDPFFPTSMSDD